MDWPVLGKLTVWLPIFWVFWSVQCDFHYQAAI